MRVQLRTLMSNAQGVWHPGAVLDVPDSAAKELIRGGYAVPVVSTPPIQRAVATPERVVEPSSGRKRK